MKKALCLCGVWLLASSLSAQTVTSKDFNDIKRSKQYFYYEITLDKEEDAKKAANVNLAKLINDYCVENAITNVKVNDNDLRNVKYLKMDKNGLVRIMAYVDKTTYIGKTEVRSEVNPEVKSEVKPEVKPVSPVVAVVKIEEHKDKKEQPSSTTVVFPPKNVPDVEVASLAKNEAVASLEKWQQDVLTDLCQIRSAEKIIMKLSDLQNQYKVKRFGLRSDCKNEQDSFWIVYDSNKNVVAILGPGAESRYNFFKGENDNLEKYGSQGLNAIWFQLSK